MFDKDAFKEGDEVIFYWRRPYFAGDILAKGMIEHVWGPNDNPPDHNFIFNVRTKSKDTMTLRAASPEDRSRNATLYTVLSNDRNVWIIKYEPYLFNKLEAEFKIRRGNIRLVEGLLKKVEDAELRFMALLP